METQSCPSCLLAWSSHHPFLESLGCSLEVPPFPGGEGIQLPYLPLPEYPAACSIQQIIIKWASGNDVFL